jgi:hypothetical protein
MGLPRISLALHAGYERWIRASDELSDPYCSPPI